MRKTLRRFLGINDLRERVDRLNENLSAAKSCIEALLNQDLSSKFKNARGNPIILNNNEFIARFLDAIHPYEIPNTRLIRCGCQNDGGYLMLEPPPHLG